MDCPANQLEPGRSARVAQCVAGSDVRSDRFAPTAFFGALPSARYSCPSDFLRGVGML